MRKYTSEMLDEYLRLQEDANDHQIRACIEFESHLDVNTLKEAFRLSFKIVPILRCRYLNKGKKSSWEEIAEEEYQEDWFVVSKGIFTDERKQSVLLRLPNQEEGPQITATLVIQLENDVLCLVVNHMVFDGSGLKTYLYLLAKLYSNIVSGNPAYEKVPEFSTERGVATIIKRLGFREKLRILTQKDPKNKGERFIMTYGESGHSPSLILYKIDVPTFSRIKTLSKTHGITVNDIMLGLFFKTLFILKPFRLGEKLTILTMIDLRRYDPGNVNSPFCNLSSMIGVQVNFQDRSFSDLVCEIGGLTHKLKEANPGLKNILLLKIARKLLSNRRYEKTLKNAIETFSLSTTNLGVLREDQLSFGSIGLMDVYLITAAKNEPALQLTISTFREQMTLSFFGYYSEENKKMVRKIIESIKYILDASISK